MVHSEIELIAVIQGARRMDCPRKRVEPGPPGSKIWGLLASLISQTTIFHDTRGLGKPFPGFIVVDSQTHTYRLRF